MTATHDPEAPAPPRAAQSKPARFKPTRAGIINLWDYFDEEFAFGDGRLALQGIDARVARAARLAADFLRAHPASSLGGQLAQDEGVFGRDLSVALESA